MSTGLLGPSPAIRAPSDSEAAELAIRPPELQRAVSTHTHGMLNALASECICPISCALMVDPVVAADGHTYDRVSIEGWIKQQRSDGQDPPRSPKTREPFAFPHLVPNVALSCTIARLVDSGRLDAEVIQEWRAAKAEMARQRSEAARDRSLARFGIGARIQLQVKLVPPQEQGESARTDEGDICVAMHLADIREGGGLFGRPSAQAGRLLLSSVSARDVLSAHPANSKFLKRLSVLRAGPLPTAPMPHDELISTVFNEWTEETESRVFGHTARYGPSAESDTNAMVSHMLARLVSDGGLPEGVRVEWEALQQERQMRQRRRDQLTLREICSNEAPFIIAVVEDARQNGDFVLRFPEMVPRTSSAVSVADNGDGSVNADASGGTLSPAASDPTVVDVPADCPNMQQAPATEEVDEVGRSSDGLFGH